MHATPARRAFRIHAAAFSAGAAALVLANALTGDPWWSFWPLVAWSAAFAVHYLVYKARTTDDRWAEQRAADLRSKSYDASHIDSIAERQKEKTGAPTDTPSGGNR